MYFSGLSRMFQKRACKSFVQNRICASTESDRKRVLICCLNESIVVVSVLRNMNWLGNLHRLPMAIFDALTYGARPISTIPSIFTRYYSFAKDCVFFKKIGQREISPTSRIRGAKNYFRDVSR
jgi:hypothetical protein